MRILLDTCAFLWIITGDAAMSSTARLTFENPDNEVVLSTISAWEITLKYGVGKLPPNPPEQLVPTQRARHGIVELPLHERAILHLPKLPPLHSDPFDRALVCQAIEHELTILTPDQLITRYAIRTVW